MSRHLPARPNLEHLRKQAKDLLEQMRRTDPSIQLADAQHALAMDYGFASWPRLRAHIEHLSEVQRASPLNGRWAADLTRSRPHPANPWQTRRSSSRSTVPTSGSQTPSSTRPGGKSVKSTRSLQMASSERPTTVTACLQSGVMGARWKPWARRTGLSSARQATLCRTTETH